MQSAYQKGKAAFCVILIAALFCTNSCKGSSIAAGNFPAARGEADHTDSQREYVHDLSRFAGNSSSLYFENSSSVVSDSATLIMFYDRDSGIVSPLCGKAECLHDDGSCNAYIGGAADESVRQIGLYMYGGRLYYTMSRTKGKDGPGVYLYSMKTDGSDRRQEMKLGGDEWEPFPAANTLTAMHRGWFIAAGGCTSVKDGVWQEEETVLLWSLETGERKVLYRQVPEKLSVMTKILIQAYDRYLYYVVEMMMQETDSDVRTTKLQVFRTDLRNSETKFLGESQVDFFSYELWIDDDKIYLSDDAGTAYRFDPEKQCTEPILSLAADSQIGSRVYFTGQYAYGIVREPGGMQYLAARNYEGDELLKLQFDDQTRSGKCVRINCGADESGIYFYYTSMADSRKELNYRDKLVFFDLKKQTEETLWSAE